MNSFDQMMKAKTVKPKAVPSTRQYHHVHKPSDVLLADTTQDTSPVRSVGSDRFEHSNKHRDSGNILCPSEVSTEDDSRLRVGRKVLSEPHSKKEERTYGVELMSSVTNSDRFQHTQRNKTSGDIVAHRDDKMYEDETLHVGRARLDAASDVISECPTEESSIRVGRGRVEKPPSIAASERSTPFATQFTPVEEIPQPKRHENHFDHHDGLLTGGSMVRRGAPKSKTPLWY
ncbi:hypothetical protein DIPPA_62774 [Diplonema papillatum]|nr:hypothetical protein DIPPA_62774 [Diplonema papillatum]